MNQIPVAGPWITEREIRYVADAATNAWYSNANVYHARLESTFADYLGVRHAITLPSCTSALHLSLLALGIGPGDEVIVPDVTWIATAAPIKYVGATTVFADIDRVTWCLDADSFAACITPRTRAVIPVDLYGGMPAFDTIRKIADRYGIAVIEDAAEAIGSTFRERRAGSFGDTGVFSFHGSKTLTTGEGGMLVTDRTDLFQRVQVLRDHGRQPGDCSFFNSEVAYKYKMSSLQAALGLAQIERIDELISRKRQIFGWYQQRLAQVGGVTLNAEPSGTLNSYWMVTAILDPNRGWSRDELRSQLRQSGIDTRPFFHPLSSLPAYVGDGQAELARQRNRVAYSLSPHGLNLPSALCLVEQDVDRVCTTLKQALNRSYRRSA